MCVHDNYDLFRRHDAEVEAAYKRWQESLPVCCKCNKKIEDDYCYDFGGDLYCEGCMDSFRAVTEHYRIRE